MARDISRNSNSFELFQYVKSFFLNPKFQKVGSAFFIGASVGALGSHLLKNFYSISPIGAAIALSLTSAISVAAIISKLDIFSASYFVALSYPLGYFVVNLMGYRVRFIDPGIAATAAGFIIFPFMAVAI